MRRQRRAASTTKTTKTSKHVVETDAKAFIRKRALLIKNSVVQPAKTVPVETLAPEIVPEYLQLCKYHHDLGLRPVEFHRRILGRWARSFKGSEFLFRIWEFSLPDWTVYVNNRKGICFEVPETANHQEALAAWNHYYRMMTNHDGSNRTS